MTPKQAQLLYCLRGSGLKTILVAGTIGLATLSGCQKDDGIPPVITLTTSTTTVVQGSAAPDWNAFVAGVSDSKNNEPKFSVQSNNVDMSTP